jgi:hypothetical protein
MEISKTAVGVLAALCIVAGAGGAYFATRTEPAPSLVGTEAPVVSPDPLASTVEQSEAIVTDVTEPTAGRAPAPPATERRTAPPRPAAPRESRAPIASARPDPAPEIETQPVLIPNTETRIAMPPALEPARPFEPEPIRAAEPAAPEFEELIVSADSVVGLQMETSITSERARVEDEVIAHVTRDVRVGDRVAIPAGAKAHGEVTLVEQGGRLRERARLGVRFTSVVLADGTRIPLETDTIYREGDAPSRESAAKIGGGAIGGAIIGGLLGGAKGAVIGGSAGAGAGTAAVLAGGRNPATLPTGTPVTVRVIKPTTVTVEK